MAKYIKKEWKKSDTVKKMFYDTMDLNSKEPKENPNQLLVKSFYISLLTWKILLDVKLI